MGHPLDAVAWLADHLASIGRGMVRGDVVITGSIVASKYPNPGDLVQFDLGPLGGVELRVD
jgi:2-keto-4-pentenoate hydratase